MAGMAGALAGYGRRVHEQNLLDLQGKISRHDAMTSALERYSQDDSLPSQFRNQALQLSLSYRQHDPSKKLPKELEQQYTDFMTAFSSGQSQQQQAAEQERLARDTDFIKNLEPIPIPQATMGPPTTLEEKVPPAFGGGTRMGVQPVEPQPPAQFPEGFGQPIPEMPGAGGPIPSFVEQASRETAAEVERAAAVARKQNEIKQEFTEQQREWIRSQPWFDELIGAEQATALTGIQFPSRSRPSLSHLGAPTEFKDKATGESFTGVPDKSKSGYWVGNDFHPFSGTESVPSKGRLSAEAAYIEEGLKIAEADKGSSLTGKERQQQKQKLRKEWAASGRDPTLAALSSAQLGAIRGMQIHPTQLGPANSLRKDFTAESKDFVKRRDSFATLQALSKEHTPGSDLGMVFAFMKMLDPPSVVREGEQALAKRAASLTSRVREYVPNLLAGKSLTSEQRADFLKQAQQMYRSFEQYNNRTKNYYTRRAEMIGVPADFIVSNADAVEPIAPAPPENPATSTNPYR